MPFLQRSLENWNTGDFAQVLKGEIEALGEAGLDFLQRASQGWPVDMDSASVSVLSTSDDGDALRVRIGIFFTELIAGCNCDDDPVPLDAYCEVLLCIDKHSAEADFQFPADR